MLVVDLAQVDLFLAGAVEQHGGVIAAGQAEAVEEVLLLDGVAQLAQAGSEDGGQPVNSSGDDLQALRPW